MPRKSGAISGRVQRFLPGENVNTFTVLILAFISATPQSLSVKDPKPVLPKSSSLEGSTIRFGNESWSYTLTSLDFAGFKDYMTSSGVGEQVLLRTEVDSFLRSLVVFRLDLKNAGPENLVFNPDHARLLWKRVPVGMQVGMADFWPLIQHRGDRGLESLARIFSKATIEITPGQAHHQLIVFKPINTNKKFPRRIALSINRLYFGIVNQEIECHFQTGYAKE